MSEYNPRGLPVLKLGNQECPICHCILREHPRYKRYLCPECASEAESEDGRPLCFANFTESGGYKAWYADTEEPYESNLCFVRGVRCWAEDAKFGGIAISALEPGKDRL